MTKQFLNEQMKPYTKLTREEKHILLDAVIDNSCECFFEDAARSHCGWGKHDGNIEFMPYGVYRTKPKEHKKLDIPWKFIKPEFKYATMDDNGDLYLYKYLPSWIEDAGVWHTEERGYVYLNFLQIDTTDVIAEHSLTERPECV